MYISLQTIDVWEFSGAFSPEKLLDAVETITTDSDVIVFGGYDTLEPIRTWLGQHGASEETPPYEHSFEWNRREYPFGRALPIHPTASNLAQIRKFLKYEAGGGIEKQLFFDHFLVYRPSMPVLPLLDFHDAFTGGSLYISGHYTEMSIAEFEEAIGSCGERMTNPVIKGFTL